MSLLSVVLSVMLCAFSTAWGCVCGVKHIKLEWENEIEVVKQGTAITLYLFPNMIATMVLIVLSVFLGMKLNGNLVIIILIFIVTLLTFMSYKKVVKLCR